MARLTLEKEIMSASAYDILIDSDAFVGWFWKADTHHEEAKEQFQSLAVDETPIATTSLVILETATVLSHRVGQSIARTFLEHINRSQLPIIYLDEARYQETIDLFKTQETKGTSMTDCGNVATMRYFGITTIFSFDAVYPKSFNIPLLNP